MYWFFTNKYQNNAIKKNYTDQKNTKNKKYVYYNMVNMERTKINVLSETKNDFKNSWKLLRENYRAFLLNGVFSLISFLTVMLLAALITGILGLVFPILSLENISREFILESNFARIYRSFFIFIAIMVFFSFLACQYGLAYDIMSSGDMFTEFRNSFQYFKKHWLRYSLNSILIRAIEMFVAMLYFLLISRGRNSEGPPPTPQVEFVIIGIIILSAGVFTSSIIFNNVLSSITSQGKMWVALKENFKILKNQPRRIISTYGLFFLTLRLPGYVIIIITIANFNTMFFPVILIVFSSIGFFEIIITNPMYALISTNIYNRFKFEQEKGKNQ